MARFFLVLLLGLPLLAQQRKADVFGLIGYGKTADDEGSLGGGMNVGGGIGYRLTRRIGIEGEVNGFRSRRDFGHGVPSFQHSGAHAMANVLAHFGPPRSQFYLLGGVGLVHVKNVQYGDSGIGLNLGFGAGFKAFVSERVYVRPDFRLMAGDGGNGAEAPFAVMRVGIGLGYCW
jgi:hypothetical protein